MRTSDFGYDLPPELIAQNPLSDRDKCKMLVLDRSSGAIYDKHFFDIYDFINPGDLLVVNETRVLPARLIGNKKDTGGQAEILLLKKLSASSDKEQIWEALVKPGKRLKPANLSRELNTTTSKSVKNFGPVVNFSNDSGEIILQAEIIDWAGDLHSGMRKVKLSSEKINIDLAIHECGKTPLPPYIHGYSGNMEMYQTVYSKTETSAAAPTAGLHFTSGLIEKLKAKGVEFAYVNLAIGIDTFKPVSVDNPKDHKIHTELYSISQKTIDAIKKTKKAGMRVIAVGTTSMRTLESCNMEAHLNDATSLFILPGYKFSVVDALITNFHVPQSTLMMLVCAFGGYENIKHAYQHAIDNKYRFLSFGDAMFIE